MIVAPVVVKPETVSKKASIYDGIAPEIKNGSAPNMEENSQPKVTITRPSFALILNFSIFILDNIVPTIAVSKILIANANISY